MKREIDLFAKVKVKRPGIAGIIIAAVVALALGFLAFITIDMYGTAEANGRLISTYEEYTTRQDVKDSYASLKEKENRTKAFRAFLALAETASEADKQAAGFDGEDYNTIVSVVPDGVTIRNFIYENRQVTVECTATDGKLAAEYAAALDESGKFQETDYDGFYSTAEGAYEFSVVLKIKEKA